MINGVKRFFEIKENANCTNAIIKGISYIFKHDQHVEWLFLKPNCFLFIILHLLRKLSNLFYISFSSIFENIGSREIGP